MPDSTEENIQQTAPANPVPTASELAKKANDDFVTWWDSHIPNSPFSRDPFAYQNLYNARSLIVAALANTKE